MRYLYGRRHALRCHSLVNYSDFVCVSVCVVSQLECQMVKKENDMSRQEHIQSTMMSSMQQEQQRMSELRNQMDSFRNANGLLQREIKALQDVISELKVCVVCSL